MAGKVLMIIVVLALIGTVFGGGDDTADTSKPAKPPISAEGPGGTDASGFPLDENGEVSSDPEDYRESVCKAVADDPYYAGDYEQECTAYGYGP